ncbi:hypothetical protein EJ02DRAFT_420152 [Clathrospora elynae]|uniref:Uncharacterized protein n=1 Tax=Clathrospora elynae TaxID=706981 RepID=A0A6A5SX66_9PLEO|nr:hypothetical protein EJ02DRAFT_420152 [Clathrospora elynae]
MIRLRPSELTLTPEDVEETFRRLALRQTSRAPPTLPLRAPGLSGRPILRRGPQRSTRDSITALGTIPLLQPRQAVTTSVDEDIADDPSYGAAPSLDRINSVAHSTSPTHSSGSVPVHMPASPAPRTLHLPFRLGRDRCDSATQSSPDERPVEAPHTPPTESSGHARLSFDDTSDNSPLSRSATSPESALRLRGGGGSDRDRARNIARDTPHAPSPLHQVQRLSSPPQQEPSGDPTKSPESPDEDQPVLYLRGKFKDPYEDPIGINYTFDEIPPMPHTEPRRPSGRQIPVARSLSSGNAPSYRVPSQTMNPSGFSTDDVFGTVPALGPPTGPRHATSSISNRQDYMSASSNIHHTPSSSFQADQASTRSRQFSSGASSASAPYSWPGSLASGSRQPSSEHSGQGQLSYSQYDGAAPSTEARHVIQSVNPSLGAGVTGNAMFCPSSGSSVYSSPSAAVTGQHGLSPLPSMPYTHPQSGRNPLQPSSALDGIHISGGYTDAATAAAQDLYSPLDPYSQQYLQMLRVQQAGLAVSSQSSYFIPRSGAMEAPPSRMGSISHAYNTAPIPGARAMDPAAVRQPQHRTLRSSQPSSEQLRNATNYGSQHRGRTNRSTRANQRSSENAPAIPPYQVRFPQTGRVHAQSAAFEQLQNPIRTNQARGVAALPSRHSMPQTTSPGVPPGIPPRQASRQHGEEPQRTQTHTYRPAPPSLQLQPSRDSPLTSLALDHGSGTTSRPSRSPIVRTTTTAAAAAAAATTRTRPRVPVEQRDQENDGDRSLMRREEGAVLARYGEEEQRRDTMDETPPRVGRVERRM